LVIIILANDESLLDCLLTNLICEYKQICLLL